MCPEETHNNFFSEGAFWLLALTPVPRPGRACMEAAFQWPSKTAAALVALLGVEALQERLGFEKIGGSGAKADWW